MDPLKSIKGTRDILPWESSQWQAVEKLCRELFGSYFYQEIRTPVFEKTELFARGIGEFSDIVSKEMYSFQDKGGEWLTLRPEYTASVIRSYIQHHYEQQSTLHKIWYAGPLFRQERPQAGRQRQFHQFGIELIGSEFPEADAEVIIMACEYYRKTGLKGWELHINSIGNITDRQKYIEVLKKELKPHVDALCPLCQQRFDKNTLRLFDCKNTECQAILDQYAPNIIDFLSEDDKNHFEQVCALLSRQDIRYIVNPKLVRGLDYYTRTTFEIKGVSLGAQDALCGGGRYDNLIGELGGRPTPSVGFAAGIERLLIALENENITLGDHTCPDLYVAPMDLNAYSEFLKTWNELRHMGFIIEMDLQRRSLKAMMRDAHKKNARFVTVIGTDELKSHTFVLKHLNTGKEFKTDPNCIQDILKKESHDTKV